MPKYFGKTAKEAEQALKSLKKSMGESSTQSVRETEAAAAAKAAREAREFNSPGYSTMDVKESGAGPMPRESAFGAYYDESLDAAHIGDEIPASSVKQNVLPSEPYSKPTMDYGADEVQPRAASHEDFLEAPNKTGEVDTNFKGEIEKTPAVKSDPNAVSLDHFGDDARIERFDLGQRVSPRVDQISTPVPGSKKLKEKSIDGLREIDGPNSSKDLSLVEKLNKDFGEAKAKSLAEKQAHNESLHLDKEGGIGDVVSGKKKLTPEETASLQFQMIENMDDLKLDRMTKKYLANQAAINPKAFMDSYPQFRDKLKKALIFTVGAGTAAGIAAVATTGKESQSKAPPPAPEALTPDVEEAKSEEGTKEVAEASQTPTDSPEQSNINTILNSVNEEAKSGTNVLELLKRAQESRDSDMRNANIIQGVGMIGSALGNQEKNLMEPAAENMRKNSGIELKKLEENITIRDKDPNSAESKMWRKMIKDTFGKDVDPNVSADTLKKLFPELRNMQIANARASALKEGKIKEREYKFVSQAEKDQIDMMKQIDYSLRRNNVGSNLLNARNSAARIDQLFSDPKFKDPVTGKIDYSKTTMLQRSEALKLLDQVIEGRNTVSGLKGLKEDAESFNTKIADYRKYLKGGTAPIGMSEGQLVESLVKTIHREANLARYQLMHIQHKKALPYKQKLDSAPEEAKETLIRRHNDNLKAQMEADDDEYELFEKNWTPIDIINSVNSGHTVADLNSFKSKKDFDKAMQKAEDLKPHPISKKDFDDTVKKYGNEYGQKLLKEGWTIEQ